MRSSALRLAAVASADLRTRLRRPQSVWLLAALALAAYLTVPPASSSSGLLLIDGARARYTSEALAFATATLLPIFLGLFGFYVVSRTVGHDARTGVGPLVVLTRLRTAEYVLGKLLGSAGALVAVTGGFLVCIMGMHLIRGEGPLLPQVYLSYYAVIALPCVLGVAAVALFVESVPGLRGRAGDVLYFFLWSVMVGLSIEAWQGSPSGGPAGVGRLFDYAGLGFAAAQAVAATRSPDFSIGYSARDVTKPPVDFPGLALTPEALLRRSESLLLPALLVLAAIALFHRFDPARSRPAVSAARRNPLALLRAAARLATRLATRAALELADRAGLLSRPAPFARALAAELVLTSRLEPLLVPAALASAALAVALPIGALQHAVLPVLVAALVPLLSELPVRGTLAGVEPIVSAAPGTRRWSVPLKLATAGIVALLVVAGPAARLLVAQPSAALSLVLGAALLVASCVALGVATSSSKPFLAIALAFWYLALNANRGTPALDFAGWAGVATGGVRLGYAASVGVFAAAALAIGWLRERVGD